MLLAPTGEAFYSPVATVSTLDPVRGIQEVSFPGCPNPLPPTEGTRLYPAHSLSLQWDGTTLTFRGGDTGGGSSLDPGDTGGDSGGGSFVP